MEHVEGLSVVRRERTSQAIVRQLFNLIAEERLPSGAKLPSERALMTQLQVGRTSIREALRMLEALGCVQVKHGEGAYVLQAHGLLATTNMIDSLISDSTHILQLYEVRELIEPKTAFLAASRRDDTQLRQLQSLLAQLEQAAGQNAAQAELDLHFHLAVARASGNELLFEFERVILQALQASWLDALQQPDRSAGSTREAFAIYEAIGRQKPREAERAAREHVRSGRQTSLAAYRAKLAGLEQLR